MTKYGMIDIEIGGSAELRLEHFGERVISIEAEDSTERVTGFLDPEDIEKLRAFVNEAHPSGHWTTQPPTEPGWYWFENLDVQREPVEIRRGVQGLLWAIYANEQYRPSEMVGTWYSEPLTVPGKDTQ